MRRLRPVLLALALASLPSSRNGARAADLDLPLRSDVARSTATSGSGPITFRFDAFGPGDGVRVPLHIGVGVRLSEGKPLQMLLWGGAGAVLGSLSGPFGAAVGGAAGVVAGLLFSVFVQPPLPAPPR